MSQRLSQRLCPNCRIPITDTQILEKMDSIINNVFGKFDFSVLTAEDISYMIGDDEHQALETFNNIYKQFKSFQKKIISLENENEKIVYKTKLIDLNRKLFE